MPVNHMNQQLAALKAQAQAQAIAQQRGLEPRIQGSVAATNAYYPMSIGATTSPRSAGVNVGPAMSGLSRALSPPTQQISALSRHGEKEAELAVTSRETD